MDNSNRKLKILYKGITANISAIWLHRHIPPTKVLSSPNRSKKQKTRATLSENGALGKNRLGEWAKSKKG